MRKKQSGEDDENEDADGDEEPEFMVDHPKVLEAAALLEQVCSNRGDVECSLDLSRLLHKFRGEMRREFEAGKKQMGIVDFFGAK